MPLAAIYARVSSPQQKVEQTIASQTAAVRAQAQALEFEVPEEWVFEDEGVSGATLVRPQLERLRDWVAQGQISVVFCNSPDRLARKYAYQVLLIEEFARAGAEIRFVHGPKADTPEDELLLQFQGMIAEYEKAQILERSRRGKLHRAREGSVNVLSGAPYGYRYVRKSDHAPARYDIREEQAAVVREIFRRYTTEPISIGALARWLSKQRIPTATGKSRWDRSTVWGMLKNPAYRGHAAFRKTESTGHRPRVNRVQRLRGTPGGSRPATQARAQEDWIEIPVPAILPVEVFELAERRLAENRRFSKRRTKEPSLLQGIVACRQCGYAYYRTSTRTSRRKIYYYRCLGSDNYRWEHGRVCSNRPIRQDYLDALVWEQITQLMANPTLIRQELDRRLEELHSSNPVRSQQEHLESELSRIQRSKQRLVDAYQEDLLSLDELRGRIPNLRDRERQIRRELRTLEAELLDQETYLALAENLESFLEHLQEAATKSSVEDRQRVVRLLVKEVLVDAETVLIRHSIPAGSGGNGAGYLLRGRGDDPALRGSYRRRLEHAVLHHTSREKLLDKAQDVPIGHFLGQGCHNDCERDVVEECGDVGIENDPIAVGMVRQHPLDGLMAVALRDVPEGRLVEFRFEDRGQESSEHLLGDPVPDHWNA